jgi:UDP-N-acetylmuramate--L-alanine ligase/UDP-N-acetylenolpyruvoylglucosamine reductase
MISSLTPDQLASFLDSQGPGATIHLVGAGGCGMSGLGHLLLDLKFQVSGSDLLASEETRQLQARGACIHTGHRPEHVPPGAALVVYTSAVRPDNPELQVALSRGIPTVPRAVLLASLVHRQRGICVAGMHGKTTTTALLAFALDRLGACPSYAVGALVPQLVPHARFSAAAGADAQLPFFAAEVDESDGTLKYFRPAHAIVLNVDAEHLDHFANLDAITAAFHQFTQQTSGHVVFCADDPRLAEMLARNPRAISYGRHPLATYRIEISQRGETMAGGSAGGAPAFDVWHKGVLIGSFRSELLGEQNVSNAAAVVALLHQLGFTPSSIAHAIASFRGAARRQQELYADEHCRIFEDYGHHPNEIRATLCALRGLKPRRLLVAFQPHRFTRTQYLWREFATCFSGADRLWLAELYPASEPEIPGINSGFLAAAIQAQGQSVEAVVSLPNLAGVVAQAVQPGDLILFLGAGDITQVAHQVATEFRARKSVSTHAPDRSATGTFHLRPTMKTELHAELARRLSPQTVLRCDEPLARRTTLRVGGTADLYVEPASETELASVLQFCQTHSLPFIVLGRGSNLLVRDGGVRGLVLCLAHPHFSRVEVSEERLRSGAGARLKAVAVEARRHGLTGLEFLEGIPGSVGGAMRMNAGAMGSWLFDVVESIRFMDYAGAVHERRASEVNVEYRGCPLFKDHLALEAVLHGHPASKEAIQAKMESFNRKRWESQPSQPSAGCIFKNPATVPAGRLIDELGLKGSRVGGAVVSDVHANFIVNDGTATAQDVLNLIAMIKDRARTARGIELETEVQILGEG